MNNWKLLTNYLSSAENRTNIDPLNRAQLVNDGWVFVKQGTLNLKTFLELLKTYRNDVDVIAWFPGLSSLSWLERKLLNSEYYASYKVR